MLGWCEHDRKHRANAQRGKRKAILGNLAGKTPKVREVHVGQPWGVEQGAEHGVDVERRIDVDDIGG